MRNIEYLQLTLQPWFHSSGCNEIRIKAEVNGEIYQTSVTYERDHFEDMFSHLMRMLEQQLRGYILEKTKK